MAKSYRCLFPLYAVIFIGFLGYSLMVVVFTTLLLQQGYSTLMLGLVISLYPLGQALGSPFLGALSDHYGRKKLLMLSLLCAILFYVGLSIGVTVGSLPLIMVFSFLAGLSESNIAIAQSSVADVARPKDLAGLFGYVYLSVSLAFIVGPLLGGFFAAHISDAAPFWAVTALLVIILFYVATCFTETLVHKQMIHPLKAIMNIGRMLTAPPQLRSLFFINFFIYIAIFGYFRCYPMYLVDKFHFSVGDLSIFMAWVSVPFILAQLWIVKWLSHHFSMKSITLYSALCVAAFVPLVVMFPWKFLLWVTLFLATLPIAICLPATSTLISQTAEAGEQGSVMGNNQALQVFSEAVSGFVGGALALISIYLPLPFFAGITLLAALALAWKILHIHI